jgi:hypothetical protein
MCLRVREASIKARPGTLGPVAPLKRKGEKGVYELIDKKNPKI